MLMTKFTYVVDTVESNSTITITRSEDMVTKVFKITNSNSKERIESFMDSVTDQLAQDYFPKVKKS